MGSLKKKKKSNYSSICFSLLLPSKYAGPKYASLNAMIYLIFFFKFGCATRQVGSYFLDQGWNMCPLQWKCRGLNHWTTREVPMRATLNILEHVHLCKSDLNVYVQEWNCQVVKHACFLDTAKLVFQVVVQINGPFSKA